MDTNKYFGCINCHEDMQKAILEEQKKGQKTIVRQEGKEKQERKRRKRKTNKKIYVQDIANRCIISEAPHI
uniref:Uncharacterized protein n=1 Tax=Arion vulgaris TaxID=1028688 RepID=A0A0B7BRJ9_9EUPU